MAQQIVVHLKLHGGWGMTECWLEAEAGEEAKVADILNGVAAQAKRQWKGVKRVEADQVRAKGVRA